MTTVAGAEEEEDDRGEEEDDEEEEEEEDEEEEAAVRAPFLPAPAPCSMAHTSCSLPSSRFLGPERARP